VSEPWFTYSRRGISRQVTPRNLKGWLSLLAFILLITLPGVTLLPWLLERSQWLVVPYLTMIGLVTWGFIAWAIGKSERA
jgi:hypothetical protein